MWMKGYQESLLLSWKEVSEDKWNNLNWNSSIVVQDILYYLHYLSRKVSSIVTLLKALSTQPASINLLSVPLTICNLFWPPTQ
jgi:hypothetical protein